MFYSLVEPHVPVENWLQAQSGSQVLVHQAIRAIQGHCDGISSILVRAIKKCRPSAKDVRDTAADKLRRNFKILGGRAQMRAIRKVMRCR